MVSSEITDASGMGITVIITTVMIIMMVFGCVGAKEWYATRDEYEIHKTEVQRTADTYKFETVAEVTGDDIVEFMLRYGLEYNYKVYTTHRRNGVVFSLAQIRNTVQNTNKYPSLEEAILEMFSEDYLSLIFSNDIYGKYKIYAVKADDNITTLGYVCVQYGANNQPVCTKDEVEEEIDQDLRTDFSDSLAIMN